MAQFYSPNRRVTTRQTITVTVNSLDPFGQGVAREKGKAIFIPGVLPGEQAEIELIEQKRQYSRGKLKHLLNQCSERVTPPCPHFGICGGCQQQHASEALQQASAKAWWAMDWLPSRLTALSFAVVGSFEEAIEGWRFHAQRFPNDNDGVVLAATAGAINVRLGGEALKARVDAMAAQQGLEMDADLGDSDSTPGVAPEVGHLRSVVGLVLRSVVVWMLLLALLTLARLLG